jgi:hypothetical protein
MNKICKSYNDALYSRIRDFLNAGKSAEDVCIDLTACKSVAAGQRQKFAVGKQHQRFPSLFGNML